MSLAEFLAALARDPGRVAAFVESPERFLAEDEQARTLGPDDRDALLSGDLNRIREAIDPELGAAYRYGILILPLPPETAE